MSKKYIIFIITVFYTILTTFLSLVELGDIPNLNTKFDDKIAHFLFYAIFCLLWFLNLTYFKIKRSLIAASAISILFGLIIEILQDLTTTYRTAEFLDILANTMGTIIMAALIYKKKELIVKNL